MTTMLTPKLVVGLLMQPGKAKAREINRKKVQSILTGYDPTIETRTSLFHAIVIEELPRDRLLVSIALRPNEALTDVAALTTAVNAGFMRTFSVLSAESYLNA